MKLVVKVLSLIAMIFAFSRYDLHGQSAKPASTLVFRETVAPPEGHFFKVGPVWLSLIFEGTDVHKWLLSAVGHTLILEFKPFGAPELPNELVMRGYYSYGLDKASKDPSINYYMWLDEKTDGNYVVLVCRDPSIIKKLVSGTYFTTVNPVFRIED